MALSCGQVVLDALERLTASIEGARVLKQMQRPAMVPLNRHLPGFRCLLQLKLQQATVKRRGKNRYLNENTFD
jgi:hypothetical protein